jgi:hypothetical protein
LERELLGFRSTIWAANVAQKYAISPGDADMSVRRWGWCDTSNSFAKRSPFLE